MDKILLAMLIYRKSTIYEIRNFIKDNMRAICSDSTGSIQAAIKKLLANNLIGFDEFLENSFNKKVYYVTEEGKNQFLEWINEPMSTTKAKNMEFSKFFFVGLAPLEKRIELIGKYIENLEEEKAFLTSIKLLSKEEKEVQINHSCERINNDIITKNNIEVVAQSDDIHKIVEDYIDYQNYSLDYAIAKNQFEIDWYENFVNNLKQDKKITIRLFSSSGFLIDILVKRMVKTAKKRNINADIKALTEKCMESCFNEETVDVALIGPQITFSILTMKKICEEKTVPFVVIPSVDYGRLNADKVLDLALEIVNK